MRIVNRSKFLELSAGTLYSKYEPCNFDDIEIKGESLINDFYSQQIADTVECDGSGEFVDIVDDAVVNGTSFKMDFHCEGRDGGFQEDQLFAVWERGDVEQLISRLQECLSTQETLDTGFIPAPANPNAVMIEEIDKYRRTYVENMETI